MAMGVSWATMTLLLMVATFAQLTQADLVLPSIAYNGAEQFATSKTYIYRMELDLYRDDESILFSTYEDLQTTDGASLSTLTTIPSCYLTGFKQFNRTHVAIAAHTIHCIQLFNRQDGSRKTIAGQCSSSGFRDGPLGVGKLKNPRSIEVDLRNPDRLLITDRYNHALRFVDMITGELGTVISNNFNAPRSLSWIGPELVVANSHYFSRVTWHVNGSVSNAIIAGTTFSGLKDDNFNKSRFNYPYEMVKLSSNTVLVADGSNRRLRLLDFDTQLVGVVCFNRENPCTTSSQLPSAVRSVLKVGNDVYVGIYQDIYKLAGLIENTSTHKALASCSNRTPCTSSTQPSIETLVFAGLASGVFITILLTSITCYFYWKKKRFNALQSTMILPSVAIETQPDTVSAAASRRSSHVYDDISVVYAEKEKPKPGYVYNVKCTDMGIDDDGYFEPLE